jgi:hypothetical protein
MAMGVAGIMCVVDWVTCEFPAQLQKTANTVRSNT